MTAATNIEIAGINFVIKCRDAVLVKNIPDTYKPFYRNEYPEAQLFNVAVSTEPGKLPLTEETKKIFDAGQAWSMFKVKDRYYLSLDPSSTADTPNCLAHFDTSATEATVHCSGLLTRRVNGKSEVINPFCYPLDQILLMYTLAAREGAIMHASAVEINGRGFIFPGKSGAGKSTISRTFADKGYDLLSDDRVVVRKMQGEFFAFGTPWAGEAGIAENRRLPLGGIFFIRQSAENLIENITPAAAVERLVPVTSIPWFDEETMSGILSFCEDLVLNIPVYDLYFKPGTEAVNLLEKFVSGQ